MKPVARTHPFVWAGGRLRPPFAKTLSVPDCRVPACGGRHTRTMRIHRIKPISAPRFAGLTLRSVVAVLAGAAAGCRQPAEAVLEISTDLACADGLVTDIRAGRLLGDLESKVPVASTPGCASGRIGSLVAVPDTDDEGPLAFEIVTAVGGASPGNCAKGALGCIVARRGCPDPLLGPASDGGIGGDAIADAIGESGEHDASTDGPIGMDGSGDGSGCGDGGGIIIPPAESCKVPSDGGHISGINYCTLDVENCCKSIVVACGTYLRSNDERFPASVTKFGLDKFEVTAARFRRFVEAHELGWKPKVGDGKHVHLNGGQGLSGEVGWQEGWNASVLADLGTVRPDAMCDARTDRWQYFIENGAASGVPCVNWYEAYAFCVWDGAFLPTEAEWNFAAAAGSEQRVYPWGPVLNGDRASLGCGGDGFFFECVYKYDIQPVGRYPTGAGALAHMDLAGNVAEWTLDSYGDYPMPCTDCVNLMAGDKVTRGGHWASPGMEIDTLRREHQNPAVYSEKVGFRCARAPVD
jgi:formylglycine-generating enzyme